MECFTRPTFRWLDPLFEILNSSEGGPMLCELRQNKPVLVHNLSTTSNAAIPEAENTGRLQRRTRGGGRQYQMTTNALRISYSRTRIWCPAPRGSRCSRSKLSKLPRAGQLAVLLPPTAPGTLLGRSHQMPKFQVDCHFNNLEEGVH